MKLIGHRGARGEAPENTLGGFRYLRDLGVRAVELDIQVSGDQELVVIHDYSLERSTGATGKVGEHTAADMAALDAALHFAGWSQREGVPSLRQVMEVLRDFDHIQFEVKAATEEHSQVVAAKFPALWREFGFGDRAFTTSFNPRYLQLLGEAAPEIPRGFLFEKDYAGDAVAAALALGCRSVGPHQERCTAALISAAHAQGLQVSTWTVNSVERMRELKRDGADSLITDLPRQALQDVPELFR